MNDAFYFSFKSGSGHGHSGHGHSGHGKGKGKGKGKHGHHSSHDHHTTHHNDHHKHHTVVHHHTIDPHTVSLVNQTNARIQAREAAHRRSLDRTRSHPRHDRHRSQLNTRADYQLHDVTAAQQHAADEQGRMGQEIANRSTENLGVTDPHSMGMNMGNYAYSFEGQEEGEGHGHHGHGKHKHHGKHHGHHKHHGKQGMMIPMPSMMMGGGMPGGMGMMGGPPQGMMPGGMGMMAGLATSLSPDNLSSFHNNNIMSGVIDEVKSHSTIFVELGLVGLGALLLLPKLGVKAIPQQYNKMAWIGTLASLGIGIFASAIPSHLSFQGREHGGGGGGHGGGGGGDPHGGTSSHDPMAGHPSGFGMGHEGGEHHGGGGEHHEGHGGFGHRGGEHHEGHGFGHGSSRFGHPYYRHSYPYYYPYNGPFGYIPDVYPGYPGFIDPYLPYPGYPYAIPPGYFPYDFYHIRGRYYPYYYRGRYYPHGFRGHIGHIGHIGHRGGHRGGGEHHGGGHGGGHHGGHQGGEHAHLAFSNFSPAIFPDRSEELLGIKKQHHLSLVPEMTHHQLLNPSDVLLPEEIVTDEYILGSRNPIDDSNHTPPTLLSDIY